MFSNGSSSSMSRAMVTPSLVIVGEPNFLSSTTFRPLGPIVTRTASARRSMPLLSERRAVSSKLSCLAKVGPSRCAVVGFGSCAGSRSGDDGEDVLLADDQELVLIELELGAGVLAVEDLLADLDVHRLALAVVEDAARADGDDLALLGLLLRRVGQDEPALRHLLARRRLDDDAVAERRQLGRGAGNGGQGVPSWGRPEAVRTCALGAARPIDVGGADPRVGARAAGPASAPPEPPV